MLTTDPTPDTAPAPAWRRSAVLAAAAAAVVALGVGGLAASRGDGGATPRAHSTLALKSATSGGPSMHSCIRFDVSILKDMPLAFAGTVAEVSNGRASLHVDHWYRGGDADVVTVSVPPPNTSVGTIDFVSGTKYLVTATDGTVNTCGYTGEATAELQRAFDEAFTP